MARRPARFPAAACFTLLAVGVLAPPCYAAFGMVDSAVNPSGVPTSLQSAQMAALRAADEHGLEPDRYGIAQLDALAADASPFAMQQWAELLELSFRAFATDVAYGRLTPDADPDWHIPAPDRPELPEHSGAGMDAVMPPHANYRRLGEAMSRYVAIRRDGGWPVLPDGPDLRLGMRDANVDIARKRLRMTGDFVGDTQADAWLFGASLDSAVRNFQSRHGLPVDGVIGAATRGAMNVSAEDRILQLAIAMERWRWLPRDLGDEYVWVNVPELMLTIVRDGEAALTSRAIVGHSTRPTPSLQSEISRLVFNPSWSVPESIAAEDLLPKLQLDPGFLERNGFRVYSGWGDSAREVDSGTVDWQTLSAARLPYRFVQRPGPFNSLGRVKFVFDNPYDIYLHDTPGKGLFALRTRMFSSGCVRVEQANALADYLLATNRDPAGLTAAQWLASPGTHGVDLQPHVPIYLVYMTSWVAEDGQVNFRRDLYGRDEAIAVALAD